MTLRLRKLPFSGLGEPADERQRLEDLYALGSLDTAVNARFDRYTELLTTALSAPIALISLIDQDKQWFKSAHGLSAAEKPGEVSLCAHAIAGGDQLVIEDAAEDSRFANHPAVVGRPRLRSYAGSIIRSPRGNAIGTCCVADTAPRRFTEREKGTLEKVARLIEHELIVDFETARLNQQLQKTALLDSLTGLPNLTLFSDRVASAISVAKSREQSFLLALVRVDRFDTLEAAVGRDPAAYLIRMLVERVEACDLDVSLIGQVREDKLGLCLPLPAETTPEALLDELLECIDHPLALDNHTVQLRLSIGACVFPRDASSTEKLLKRARTALWYKPLTDQSEYRLYRRGQSNAAMRAFRLESALKQALERHEFHLVYQPKIQLQTGALAGAEVLLRWTSSDLGPVSPAKFIPVAEDSGLILSIGEWVLATACEQLARWRATTATLLELAVNVTNSQLRQPGFPDGVSCLLRYHGLEAGQLNLELTESSLVDDIEGAVKIMRQLRKHGVTFSIDDFGTGFSSLSYLRQMPVKTLKIDRSFIRRIHSDEDDMKLVRSIVAMGHSLGLGVVAEGVETEQQMNALYSAGCDQGQGYLFGRPVAARQFEEYLVKVSNIAEANRADHI